MSTEATFNPDTASFEELEQRIAGGEFDTPAADAVAVAADETKQTPTTEVKPTFRREIDLGDGSGKQVFEGESAEDLIDKLAQAQTNATKKIRELAREVKVENTSQQAQERDLTADEEWLLSQELLNHPSKTLKKLVEQIIGEPIEQFKSRQQRTEQETEHSRAARAGKEFVTKHAEDFHPCPENRERIERYMEIYKLDATVENLEKAFTDLNASGLLKSRPAEAGTNGAGEAANEQEARIANTPTNPAPTQRRGGSGLNGRSRTAAPVKSATPTEREMYEMPMEDLERLANMELAGGSQ